MPRPLTSVVQSCSAPGRKAAASKPRGSSRASLALPAVGPRQTVPPFHKLQTDPTDNTVKAIEGSPRESLCWQARSHHGGSQERCPEHHAQLPHTATQTDRGSSLPHSHNIPHSSSPGAAKIRKAVAPGVSTAGRELKKKTTFIGG